MSSAPAVASAAPTLSTTLLAALVGAIAPTLAAVTALVLALRKASDEDTPTWRRRALKAEKEVAKLRETVEERERENFRLRRLLSTHGIDDDVDELTR